MSKIISTLSILICMIQLNCVNANVNEQGTASSEQVVQFDKNMKFLLKEIVISDNKTIPTNELKEIYKKYINKNISLKDVENIISSISYYYKSSGFILSQAYLPKQTIGSDGILYINIAEGYVDKVVVKGNVSSDTKDYLKEIGNRIVDNKPITSDVLERYSLLADDVSSTNIKLSFAPSVDNLYASTVTFLANEDPYNLSVSFDNYGSNSLGKNRITLQGNVYNIIDSSDSGAIILLSKFGENLKYFNVFHNQSIGSDGLYVNLNYTNTSTKPELIDSTTIKGKNHRIEFSAKYPIVRQRLLNIYVQSGFIAAESNMNLEGLNINIYDEKYREFNVSLNGSYADMYGVTYIETIFHQGIDGLGAETKNPTRGDGSLSYSKLNYSFYRSHSISDKISLALSSRGQYAFNTLLATQEISYGGAIYGSAFPSSKASGEHGIMGKLELRYNAKFTTNNMQFLIQPLVFIDAGTIWNNSKNTINGNVIEETKKFTGTCFGFGANFLLSKHAEASIKFARSFESQDVDTEEDKLLFSIKISDII